MKLAIIGATGLVGQNMLEVLEARSFPVDELILAASERSIGKKINFKSMPYEVVGIQTALDKKPDIALFSAGGGVSKDWAPKFAEAGSFVVDNSSAWRMEKGIPLVVPEINPHTITAGTRIIANPNCSTIQMVMALAPLHQKYGLHRLVISTYQSITGTGYKAVAQMEAERQGIEAEKVYPHPIDKNALPHCDVFLENDYTKEEMKLVNETRKILEDERIGITATAVRVPVVGGHAESVNAEFNKEFVIEEVRELLSQSPGNVVQDTPQANEYPTPRNAQHKDEVFIGRLRRDESHPRTLNLWIVADNLRKGAATNTIQIGEYLAKKFL